ncbi:Hypp8936 [Branchiostoma lanceolatum]|uniref:Hypp8936 protein n=1 Tax=Branchiostoma lanceolatum TaxID=7740 RepID=A0A8K0EFB2_BRALA|nr:Hypp8936 [Branchiostoma lanceolatum]
MADAGEETEIQFNYRQITMVSGTPTYGTFMEKVLKYCTPTGRLVGAEKLTLGNSDKALLNVYVYSIMPGTETEQHAGTYVALQFLLSRKFLYGRRVSEKKALLNLKEGGWNPYPLFAENINTTDDPRVFLMKETGSDVVLAWQGDTNYLITLREDSKIAVLGSKANGGDGTLLKLHVPVACPTASPTPTEPHDQAGAKPEDVVVTQKDSELEEGPGLEELGLKLIPLQHPLKALDEQC